MFPSMITMFSTSFVCTMGKMFRNWRNVKSRTFNTCERRNSPTDLIVLEVDHADRLLDVLGDFMELGRAGPTFLKQPVRISGFEPAIGDLEFLAAEGVNTRRNSVPLHSNITIGSSCNFMRRKQGSASRPMDPHP